MGGAGQVGGAIASILKGHGNRVEVLDIKVKPRFPADIMHVAIPYSKDFLKIVRAAVKRYKVKLVIVHSTVPIGTTRQLGPMSAHSPVRGQHDNLEWSLLRFIKYVAGTTKKAGDMAFSHLQSNGFPVFQWAKPEDTELMKQLCLSRYLNDLAFYETAYQVCVDKKVSPGLMLHWTDTYNDGYMNTKYMRPQFNFPRGVVGGHCVMPVSKMLYEGTNNKFLGRNIELFESRDLH